MHVITKPISEVLDGVKLVSAFLEGRDRQDIGKIREALDDAIPMLQDLRTAISEESIAEAVARAGT